MDHNIEFQATLQGEQLIIAFNCVPNANIRHDLKTEGFAYDGDKQQWSVTFREELKHWISEEDSFVSIDRIMEGDCLDLLPNLKAKSIDMVLTDPPYLVDYKDRSGRKVANDNNDKWVAPVFNELYRVLKDNSICITFCALPSIVAFMDAAQASGFRSLGQLIWPKRYASSKYHLAFKHEQALVFAKGKPSKPEEALPTIQKWHYSGNELHPTQKHTDILIPLIEQYTKLDDVILDPFCGSGSTLVAANQIDRHFIGMELNNSYIETVRQRLKLKL